MSTSRAGTGCAILVIMAAGLAAGILYRHRPVPSYSSQQPTGSSSAAPGGPGRPALAADQEAVLASLLRDDVADVRVYACEMAGRSRDRKWIPALLVRAGDQDEVVRRAAISSLHKHRDYQDLALAKDDAIDQSRILRRLANLTLASLCELWADGAYTVASPVLVDACLQCHAGKNRFPLASNERCRGCHEEIYAEWVGSAHTQSLSHLHLAAPGDGAGKPVAADYGELRGISCVECHRITATRADPPSQPATVPAECIHVFAKDSTGAEGCARCHADTTSQWQDWIARPQPHQASWPPGDIVHTSDHRDCVDCHMPKSQAPSAQPHRNHRWSARRNLPLLRNGIHVTAHVTAGEQTQSLVVVLTNTSGHSYPTGTCRRTLELLVTDAVNAEPAVAVRFGTSYPTHPGAALAPPLRPGERREIRWPLSPGAESVRYRLRYVRDRLNPDLYSTDILAGERRLQPWTAAE